MNEKILRINHSVDFSRMREKAEWLNYWWSDEQEDVPKRYLLIGDSICRAYRGAVEKISGVPVDYIGTSSILPDERFLKQIEAFFDCSDACSVRGGRRYYAVQIQIGVHAIQQVDHDMLDADFYAAYKEQYKYLIEYLMERADKVVLASTTPVVERFVKNRYLNFLCSHCHPRWIEKLDVDTNREVEIRNKIAEDLAAEYKILFNDLYSYMKTTGKDFKHIDIFHYTRRGDAFLAQRVYQFLELKEE